MTVYELFFYVFSASVIFGALMTIFARSPVHAVLWLISTFLSSSGLFILLGAEFIAATLIIVYVGAVAVLFLFVVMMMDIDFAALNASLVRYIPIVGVFAFIFFLQFGFIFSTWIYGDGVELVRQSQTPDPSDVHNTQALGVIIYDDYLLPFQLAGLVLLVAMIGAIMLTLRHRQDVKRQSPVQQMQREPLESVFYHNVKPYQGLEERNSDDWY